MRRSSPCAKPILIRTCLKDYAVHYYDDNGATNSNEDVSWIVLCKVR